MSNLLKSKILLGVLVVAVLVVGGVVALKADTAAAETCTINSTLRVGSTGAEVMCLQSIVGAAADGVFGPMTKAAVMTWQTSKGLVADGVFGPLSKAAWLAGGSSTSNCPVGQFDPMTGQPCGTSTLPAGCMAGYLFSPTTGQSCTGGSTSSGPLTGGAGTVDEYKLLASPSNNREVGEDSDDVKVLGMSVEADGSDLEVTAMKLEFTWNTADEDFSDYATEVAIWMGSDELARVDAEDFTENSATDTWSKNITLADGGIVRDGDVENFYVTVSGVSNIDSADLGETWDLDVTSVRFADAQGALISEDPTLDARTFSFESLATADDLELKLTEHTSNPEAGVVEVNSSDSTDNVLLLKTNLKAIGGDIDLKEMTVNIVATGTGDVDEIASAYMLVVDGEEFSLDAGDCDAPACDANEDYTFDDIDMTIDEGETVVVEVFANVNGTDDYAEGDSLVATIDNDDTVAEDVSGEDLEITDLTGLVVGEEQALYSEGIKVSLVGTPSATKVSGGDPATVGDTATFVIKYKVEAFNSNAYIDNTLSEDDDQGDAGEGTSFLFNDGNGITDGTVASTVTSTGTTTANNNFEVLDGESETITITIVVEKVPAETSEFIRASLEAINWALTDVAAPTLFYDFNLDEYETDDIYVKNAS